MRKLGFLAVLASTLGLMAMGCEPAKKKGAEPTKAPAGDMKDMKHEMKTEPAEGTHAAPAADEKPADTK